MVLRFSLNAFQYPSFTDDDHGVIRFITCSRFRLGGLNEDGWRAGECRYSKIAPAWGEFYELIGPDEVSELPTDWVELRDGESLRHFLFYFSDQTFECFAADWMFQLDRRIDAQPEE